jgi:hypothetical protein
MTSCGWNRNFATQLIFQKIDRLTDVLSMLQIFVRVKIKIKTKPIAKLIWQLLTLDVNSFSSRKKQKANNFSSSKVNEDILSNKM